LSTLLLRLSLGSGTTPGGEEGGGNVVSWSGQGSGGGHNVMTSVCLSLTLALVRLGDHHLCGAASFAFSCFAKSLSFLVPCNPLKNDNPISK